MGKRLEAELLDKAMGILTSIVTVCDRVRKKETTFIAACREQGLDHAYTRRLILDFLGKCPETRQEFGELALELEDPYEEFYKDIFGDRSLTAAKLPVDYRETVDHIILDENILSEQESFVINHTYGLFDDGEPMSQESMAPFLGVTRERVRQIKCKAFRKCRRRPYSDMLRSGLAIYTQEKKQEEEILALRLECSRKEHEALMEKMEKEHEEHLKRIRERNYTEIIPEDLSQTPIETLELSIRSFNVLFRGQINNLDELMKIDTERLMDIRGMGRLCRKEILDKLDAYLQNTYHTSYEECRMIYKAEK